MKIHCITPNCDSYVEFNGKIVFPGNLGNKLSFSENLINSDYQISISGKENLKGITIATFEIAQPPHAQFSHQQIDFPISQVNPLHEEQIFYLTCKNLHTNPYNITIKDE